MSTIPADPPVLEGFDLFSPEFLLDPFPTLERARRECPVFYYPPMDFWVVTRYDDVCRVVTDHETFSNRVWRTVPRPDALEGRFPANLMSRAFINLDPPEHTVSRKNANRAFTRGRVAALEPAIREITNSVIDRFASEGRCDLMRDFAYPTSLHTIVRLLGLPEEDMPRFRQWTEDMFSLMTPGAPDGSAGASKPMPEEEVLERYERLAEAYAYYTAIVEDRRREPRDDLTSALVHAEGPDGTPALDTERIIVHMIELTGAGHDTTANLMGNAVMFLTADPEQLAEVREDPELLVNAVEEALRRRPTSPKMFRRATREVEIRGVTIPAGSVVCIELGSASNDEERFPEPERFDVHRENADEHLAFGRGRHFCMGAPLARLEARVALGVLLERLPGLRVVPGQRLEYARTVTLDTLTGLEVEWPVPA